MRNKAKSRSRLESSLRSTWVKTADTVLFALIFLLFLTVIIDQRLGRARIAVNCARIRRKFYSPRPASLSSALARDALQVCNAWRRSNRTCLSPPPLTLQYVSYLADLSRLARD